MASFSIVRPVTDQDYSALAARGRAFVARHNLTIEGLESAESDREVYRLIADRLEWFDNDDARAAELRRMWIAVFRRAVGDRRATSIAYDAIGYTVASN